MRQVAPGVDMIDTRLGGSEGITAAYLVRGPSPALVETGAQTSAAAVRAALEEAGIGAEDLAWIVLTHVHLDHCGGAGLLARAFPRARVVVHRRGARHLAEPDRLVAASADVYGPLADLYGGLDPVPEDRILAAEDGQRVPVGPDRHLTLVEALGHARHHMAVLDERAGVVLAGDALGARFAPGGLYIAVPPPDFDLDRSRATLRRLGDIDPTTLCLAHFGPVPDPRAALADAERQQVTAAGAALAAWRRDGTPAAVARAVEAALPLAAEVRDPDAVDRWRRLRWGLANVDGLVTWARSQPEEAPSPSF